MKTKVKKISSVFLSVLMIVTALMPGFNVFAANPTITITDENGAEITQTVEVQEYRSVQLSYVTSEALPEGAYVGWESNLPLLADVDDTGKVTGYDYSKAAIIQLWLDEEVRTIPLIGESMAKSIEDAIANSGYDLETVNTDVLVALVRGIAGDTIADSLKNYLDNMNVEVTATLYGADGTVLNTDTVGILVTQSLAGSIMPTSVHITNKKSVPTTVAVGTTVQLYGAVTPVRLKQGVKWTMGTVFDTNSKKHATVSSDGLVTFTSAGEATVRVNPESAAYQEFTDTVTFTIVEPSELPVTDFTITGTTTVTEGETTQLAIDDLTPAGAYTGDLVWSSSDPTVAVVDGNGIVTGLDGGSGAFEYSKKVTITATIGSVSKSVEVTVKRPLTSATISGVEISGEAVIPNDTASQYTATIYPARFNTNSSVLREWGLVDLDGTHWASADTPAETELASIDASGLLTPKSSGVITLAVRATYNGTVVENTMEVISGTAITDFAIEGSSSVTENSTTELSITVKAPDNYDEALLSTVKWSSADTSVASVEGNGEKCVVKGLDAGGYGPLNSNDTIIYATIGGVTKEFKITVKGALINYVTSASIEGFDSVIKDFPVQYTAKFTPVRLDITKTLWGLPTDDGVAPWTASNTLNKSDNMQNSIASVDENGLVTGLSVGTTTLHLFGRRNLTSHNETEKTINVVELEPKSITITAPTRTDYVEGETELDLTGLKVELTYDRTDIEQYYGDTSALYTDEQLKVEVNDYTVSEINQSILDSEQYIVASVTRAGKVYRGVFSITLASKALTSIDITSQPKYKYIEGEDTLDLSGLSVTANYSNAESEAVTDYEVDTSAFDPQLFNVEQTIPVAYTHAGRSATSAFPVIVYGIPVVSVDTGGYTDGWSSGDVTFTLSSTNELDGITYYYRTDTDAEWKALSGNTYTVSQNSDETYYFKAINSENIESAETLGFNVKRDDITPSFTLSAETSELTNQSYKVNIDGITLGSSGIKSITLNDADITGNTHFTADENGSYTVIITANNGLSHTEIITVENIDKDAPTVNSITLAHKNDGSIARFLNEITFGKFFNRQIEISIDAVDTGVAGIDTVEYRYLDENGLPTGNDWQVYDENNKPAQEPDFKGYVQARATDKAGNVSDVLRSDGYVIDGTQPTEVQINAVYKDSQYVSGEWVADSVNITVSSEAFSGIYEYRYRVDGGEWQSMSGNTLTADIEGEHLYEFKAISNSALDSEISSLTVKIDRQVPVVRVDFAGTFGKWTGEEVTFSFSTLESSISGITYYYNNGGEWVEITSGSSLSLDYDTNATYMFKAVNGAGTESNPSDSYVVMIDTVVPSVTPVQTVTESTCVPYEVSIEAVAGAAGIKSVTMNGEDITGQNSVTVSENGIYLFVITGNNQKTSTYLLNVENFYDPVISITGVEFNQIDSGSYARKTDGEFGTFYKENTEITITAQNTGVTGIEKIEYRLLDENKQPAGDWAVYNEEAKPLISNSFKGYVEAAAYSSDGSHSESFISEAIVVDTSMPSAPVISAVSNGEEYTGEWTGNEITFTLSSSAYSGIYEYKYCVDGGEWQSLSGDTLTVSENGEHTYEFVAVSNSTLESAVSSFDTKTDSAVPSLGVSVNGTVGVKTGDKVEFTLSAPNTVSGVTYYYDNGSGWIAMEGNTLTVDETVTADYAFKAVNGAGVESDISPVYKVIIDKDYDVVERKPILSVSINGTVGTFTANDVTFTLSSADARDGVTYYYSDGGEFKAISGNVLTLNSNTDKAYSFKAVDGTGKESAVSESYQVKIDKTVPTVQLIPSAQAKPNDTVTVTVNTVVGISGIKSVTVNGKDLTGETSFDVADNGTYTVRVTANNGLAASDEITLTAFDREAPQIDDITLKQINTGSFSRLINGITFGLFFNEEVELNVSASDKGNSGVKAIEYRILDENGAPTGGWKVYSESSRPTLGSSFKGYVEVKATDNANNVSDILRTDGFVVDCENPSGVTITAKTSDGKAYDGSFTNKDVILTVSSTAFSDIYEYLYRVDEGEWAALEGNTLTALDGVHKYDFKAVSYSANVSEISSFTAKIDRDIPVLSVNVSGTTGSWTADNVVFSLSAENVNSGITYYYNDGSGFKKLSGNVLSVDSSVNKTYTFKAVNGAGTESGISESYKVMIDKNVPSISAIPSTENYTNSDISINVSVSNVGGAGLKSLTVNGAHITGEASVKITENGVYTFVATGNNGLSAVKTVTVNNIDRISPEITEISLTHSDGTGAVNGNVYKDSAVIAISAFDSGTSGIKAVEYRLLDESGRPSTSWERYTESDKPVIDTNFKGFVQAKVTDNAGNLSAIYSGETVIVDNGAPSAVKVSASYDGKEVLSGTRASKNVTIELSGDAFSGIKTYQYSLNGADWIDTDGVVTTAEAGEYNYQFRAVSNSGAVSEITEFSVTVAAPISMYRLYNPNSGEHFYTSKASEKDNLVKLGWKYEGIGWLAPETSDTPVYRLYNENGGEHHYTLDAKERNLLVSVGWTYEGIGWYSDDAKEVALYRQYNPNAFANNHNYTTDKSENDWLVSIGWQAEGIGWYGIA